ncbi:MAG: hypothetical protein COV45_09155 [Deltaproteobacteria bacterium CG11_big_fil_rev_8_21_14_0_20_47_16]|nr:MAG: hypothetical protein COV45_09155 [Deltaproteobacteria bacterium CG11_big_fil_rev_8_21_14_0_20_47_16]
MSDNEKNLPPKIYHQNDPDNILDLWKTLASQISDDFRSFIAAYDELVDPDTSPMIFVELMLRQLGNPFRSYPLTDTQKRKLVKLLIPMYNQKGLGKEKGIVTAARFLLGMEVEIIDPHAYPEDGWHVGVSEIGLSTYSGGRRVYCNLLEWTEVFSETEWIRSLVIVTPQVITGPTPWGRDADQLDMSTPGALIYQDATPFLAANQPFTGSIWLKADMPGTLTFTIQSVDNPLDQTEGILAVTSEWQRFVVQHQCLPNAAGDIRFLLKSDAGFAGDLYAWGAQMVRSDDPDTPYAPRTDDADDCDRPGAWAFHFFIQTPRILTDDERDLLHEIADFMKPAHTHYGILEPDAPGFVDHWEVGVSEVGVNTYVH